MPAAPKFLPEALSLDGVGATMTYEDISHTGRNTTAHHVNERRLRHVAFRQEFGDRHFVESGQLSERLNGHARIAALDNHGLPATAGLLHDAV